MCANLYASLIYSLQMELKLPTGVVLKVMFERMVQKNKVTGWDRRVRRCVKHESDEGNTRTIVLFD